MPFRTPQSIDDGDWLLEARRRWDREAVRRALGELTVEGGGTADDASGPTTEEGEAPWFRNGRLVIIEMKPLQHVVNHASYHRGQATTMLRQLHASPAESMDLITFYRSKAQSL